MLFSEIDSFSVAELLVNRCKNIKATLARYCAETL